MSRQYPGAMTLIVMTTERKFAVVKVGSFARWPITTMIASVVAEGGRRW